MIITLILSEHVFQISALGVLSNLLCASGEHLSAAFVVFSTHLPYIKEILFQQRPLRSEVKASFQVMMRYDNHYNFQPSLPDNKEGKMLSERIKEMELRQFRKLTRLN